MESQCDHLTQQYYRTKKKSLDQNIGSSVRPVQIIDRMELNRFMKKLTIFKLFQAVLLKICDKPTTFGEYTMIQIKQKLYLHGYSAGNILMLMYLYILSKQVIFSQNINKTT